MNNRCRTCIYFKRGKWHKAIDPEENKRLGGTCELLLGVLSIENSWMAFHDGIAVQDTFGCCLHMGKK